MSNTDAIISELLGTNAALQAQLAAQAEVIEAARALVENENLYAPIISGDKVYGAIREVRKALATLKEREQDETEEILSDPSFMSALNEGLKDLQEGKLVPWEQEQEGK